MPPQGFFNKTSMTEKKFQARLLLAIELIKENQSVVAQKVLVCINANLCTISSFFSISKEDYHQLRRIFIDDYKLDLSREFPPTYASVCKIELEVRAMIFPAKNNIYIKSTMTVKEIASAIVHEVCHLLNDPLYKEEIQSDNYEIADYRDEIRSLTAEKMFARNGQSLRRSDIKKIYATVDEQYPELIEKGKSSPKPVLVYGNYDSPIDMVAVSRSLTQ